MSTRTGVAVQGVQRNANVGADIVPSSLMEPTPDSPGRPPGATGTVIALTVTAFVARPMTMEGSISARSRNSCSHRIRRYGTPPSPRLPQT
jgi:hypothetical protein